MKITVGIPCWKQAEYLAGCIQSVIAQTYKDIEIIVVDDGSPDNTAEVASQFPVKLVRQVNKGLSSARNTAIMNMTGDYFLPLDADDLLLPNCIQRIVDTIEQTGADIIAPSLTEFGISSQTIILKPEITIEDFKVANHIGYFSAIKKEALLAVGGYSPKMVYGYEDWHLWFDLIKRGYKLAIIQEPLVMYRTKANSMITTANAHRAELMAQIYKDHQELFHE